jgi:hypothetical protein
MANVDITTCSVWNSIEEAVLEYSVQLPPLIFDVIRGHKDWNNYPLHVTIKWHVQTGGDLKYLCFVNNNKRDNNKK